MICWSLAIHIILYCCCVPSHRLSTLFMVHSSFSSSSFFSSSFFSSSGQMLDEALMIKRSENKGNSRGVVEEVAGEEDDDEVDASIAYHQGRVLSKELRIQACLALGMLLPPHHIAVGEIFFFYFCFSYRSRFKDFFFLFSFFFTYYYM